MCQLSVHVSFYLDVGRNVHHSDMKQVVFRRRIYKFWCFCFIIGKLIQLYFVSVSWPWVSKQAIMYGLRPKAEIASHWDENRQNQDVSFTLIEKYKQKCDLKRNFCVGFSYKVIFYLKRVYKIICIFEWGVLQNCWFGCIFVDTRVTVV